MKYFYSYKQCVDSKYSYKYGKTLMSCNFFEKKIVFLVINNIDLYICIVKIIISIIIEQTLLYKGKQCQKL